jgi:hypothetical protein
MSFCIFSKLARAAAVAAVAAITMSVVLPQTAMAAVHEEQRIGQFGSPVEWRTQCANWIKIFGTDQCIGHAYQNLQHDFTLVLDGPDVDQAVKQVLIEALGIAASAAVNAGVLTPDPTPGAARIPAAIAAGKLAFVGYLSARGLQELVSQYDIRINHRTFW